MPFFLHFFGILHCLCWNDVHVLKNVGRHVEWSWTYLFKLFLQRENTHFYRNIDHRVISNIKICFVFFPAVAYSKRWMEIGAQWHEILNFYTENDRLFLLSRMKIVSIWILYQILGDFSIDLRCHVVNFYSNLRGQHFAAGIQGPILASTPSNTKHFGIPTLHVLTSIDEIWVDVLQKIKYRKNLSKLTENPHCWWDEQSCFCYGSSNTSFV